MTTKPEKAVLDGAELSAINNALAPSMVFCIESMGQPHPRNRRGVDFKCIDGALAAAERLIEALGPDTPVPGRQGDTPSGLLAYVQGVAELAAPYRPAKERRA